MVGVKFYFGVLFFVIIGDGGLGEFYIMSSFGYFYMVYF